VEIQFQFSMRMPDALHGELIEASRERRCSPEQFCSEAVEVLLAGRREQRLRPEDCYARKGPRPGGNAAFADTED
jgi:hypothetical protein